MDIKKQFGQRVRQLRQKKGWSQEILAQKSGLHRTYIGIVERGEKNLSLENIGKLSEVFNIKTKDLFDFQK